MTNEADVWQKSGSFLTARYQQDHFYNFDGLFSKSRCYMERIVDSPNSDFEIKDGLPYVVTVGYNIYDIGYSIYSNSLLDEDEIVPLYTATSAPMDFYWFNIDGAGALLSAGVAAVVAIFAF